MHIVLDKKTVLHCSILLMVPTCAYSFIFFSSMANPVALIIAIYYLLLVLILFIFLRLQKTRSRIALVLYYIGLASLLLFPPLLHLSGVITTYYLNMLVPVLIAALLFCERISGTVIYILSLILNVIVIGYQQFNTEELFMLLFSYFISILIVHRHFKAVQTICRSRNDRDNLNRQYKELSDSYSRLLLFKFRISSTILNEIEAPLQVITELSEQTDSKGIPIINQTGEQVQRLLFTLSDIIKFENQDPVLEKTDVMLYSLIASSQEDIISLCEQKNIRLLNEINHEVTAYVDRERIKRALVAIYSNSLRYSSFSENLHTRTTLKEHNTVCIEIEDKNPARNIKDEELIFDYYARQEGVHRDLSGSYSIALYYAQLSVEAHGCKVGHRKDEEGHCYFWITLPISENTKPR